MCLLIAMFGMVPDAPLQVAANRDERFDRPAVPITVLRERQPRILGGRDELAGGTWLAVNEHGVVAGLTNQPSFNGRDPAKRSRGELPLAFASWASAAEAVEKVSAALDPASYNPCWMLVGDRETLFFIGIAGAGKPEVEQLGPGLHVLENSPLRPRSAKAAFVTQLVTKALAQHDAGAAGAIAALETVLRDHRPAITEPLTDSAGRVRPPELSAACVHGEGYGTRSAMTVSVPASGLPSVRVADGRPCEHDLRDVTGLWTEQPPARLAG
ncbi:MAG TPA: NRDE family protein [Streptosporangiaceae bacterium]|nr:NRDE family protein [Streptosporangiaceae bacterium]